MVYPPLIKINALISWRALTPPFGGFLPVGKRGYERGGGGAYTPVFKGG